MPVWLTSGAQTSGAQPSLFSIPCVCGDTVRGERIDRAVEISCPGCGEAFFVLPADVYPAPETKGRFTGKTRLERHAPRGGGLLRSCRRCCRGLAGAIVAGLSRAVPRRIPRRRGGR